MVRSGLSPDVVGTVPSVTPLLVSRYCGADVYRRGVVFGRNRLFMLARVQGGGGTLHPGFDRVCGGSRIPAFDSIAVSAVVANFCTPPPRHPAMAGSSYGSIG